MSEDPTIVPEPGGQGVPITVDPKHTRQHLNMMERMVRLGTLTPEQQGEVRDEALIVMRKCTSERDKAAALRVLAALERNDIKKLEVALKAAGVGVNQTNIQNNTQQNTIDLSGLTIEQLKALAGGSDS